MNTPGIIALTALGTLVVAGIGYGGFQAINQDDAPAFAEVINVEPIVQQINTPREVCRDVAVTRQAEPRDGARATGTILGAVVGGVVGHQFGGGSGKDVATAGGAVAGGYAGNQIQKGMQERNTVTTTEQRCDTVTETRSETVGYEVTYMLGDEEGTVEMKEQPGERLRVENGKVITD